VVLEAISFTTRRPIALESQRKHYEMQSFVYIVIKNRHIWLWNFAIGHNDITVTS